MILGELTLSSVFVMEGESMGSIGGGSWARVRVIHVLRECIWDAPTVSLVLPVFDDTGSLGFLPRQVVYPPGYIVPSWVIAFRFLVGNSETELKPTTFSSLLLFRVFLSFLFP